ncbi:MAG TPA: hypothetical protein VKB34_01245 [Povalibacter sp.]|nr:hypothetical protein [Povalibacter sp.]
MSHRILLVALPFMIFGPVLVWARADDCTGGGNTPLIVDLKGDGIRLGPAGVAVYFDLDADGIADHLQWVRPLGDEAFIFADLNGNGIADDGSELFGEGTTLVLQAEKARNGFIALAQYDQPALGGNDDGKITEADGMWPMLKFWTDSNADGRSVRSETKSARALGIVAFDIIPRLRNYMDDAGNTIPFWAQAERLNGKKVLMVDVFFRRLP